MILIFGDTKEGRKAAAVCDQAAKPFYYSTTGNARKVAMAAGIRLTGVMDEAYMASFCRERNIRLIVDAAHPFAEVIHQHIAAVSEQLHIPVIRYERNNPQRKKDPPAFNSCDETNVKRPVLPSSFLTVNGENGLRKIIENFFPSFFELKTGYTTGACATAAAKAALMTLLTGEKLASVDIRLPNRELVNLPIYALTLEEKKVSCSVLKDGGDDPDVTNGLEIIAAVQLNGNHKGVHILRGEGVGVVTLPGLGLKVGEPAVNKTPRSMIKREIKGVMSQYRDKLPGQYLKTGVDITLSVPKGEKVAVKTFNPRLGIMGGISILGTSGIVKPFSSDAFIVSIHRGMQIAKALNLEHIIINSGAKSELFIKKQYPKTCEQAFIHYGSYIGEAIKAASALGFKRLTMGIMIGKAVKLAEGSLDTHSNKVVMNKDFLITVAREVNCSETTLDIIRNITMARQLWETIPLSEHGFFIRITRMCHDVCKPLFPDGVLEILLINEKGETFKIDNTD